MPIERLDSTEELAVVATRNEDLSVIPDCGLQQRKRSRAELVCFEDRYLVFARRFDLATKVILAVEETYSTYLSSLRGLPINSL